MKYVSVVAFITFCLLCSCLPKTTVTPVDSYLVKYFNYQPGTYWIYKDSLAGEIDSFYVTDNNVKITGVSPSYDNFNFISITQIKEGSTPADTVYWSWIMGNPYISYSSKGMPAHADRDYAPLLCYPFSTTGFAQTSNTFQASEVIDIFPAYTVSGLLFTNVEAVHFYGYYGYNDWMYIDTAQGIVKMRWSDTTNANNKVWELQRWNIVR